MGVKEGFGWNKRPRNQIDLEIQQLRGEMGRLKSDMISQTAQTFAATTTTGGPGNPARGTRTPLPANPTTPYNVRGSPPIFAHNWNGRPTAGMFRPENGFRPDSCTVVKNNGYAPVGYDGRYVLPEQPVIILASGIVDACQAFTPATYAQWGRGLNLWISSPNGASIAQLLAKIIAVLPVPSMIDGLEYMEAAETTRRLGTLPSISTYWTIDTVRQMQENFGLGSRILPRSRRHRMGRIKNRGPAFNVARTD